MDTRLTIGVLGVGHVGLVTAAALAHAGHRVIAYDSDTEKIRILEEGGMPFFEPDLEDLCREGEQAGRLSYTRDAARAIAGVDVVFICVGTPPRANGDANLLAVERSAHAIAEHRTGPLVVVEKSTVPAGTAERVAETLDRLGDHEVAVASNPEFLREGRAVGDSLHPDRILVGTDAPQARAALRRVYASLIDAGIPYVETDLRTAELAKHACNAFLAMKISYANALARICERTGADVVAIADVMGRDPRIGRDFLDAGLGFGGYCFPKDLQAFERFANQIGYDFGLLREVGRINDEAVRACFERIREACWNLETKRIALLGLAFKPGTDDVRFAPALVLARLLLEAGAVVVGFDPKAERTAKEDLPALEVVSGPYEAATGAHCVVLCTEWSEIRDLDLARLRGVVEDPVLVDARNVYDPETAAAAGFRYYPVGRPSRA